MRRRYIYLILFCVITAGAGAWWFAWNKRTVVIEYYEPVGRMPSIKPDYTETVIPSNIAPLNFTVLEPGTEYLVKIHSTKGESFDVYSKTGNIEIPLQRWKLLLNANRGKELSFDVYVRNIEGLWNRYEKISNTIAREDIDPYLVYRFMKPIFNWWKNISIDQRHLEDYDKSVVLHSKDFGYGCLNCHTFLNNTPENMTLGFRSAIYGSGTVMADHNNADKIDAKWGYTAWHPSGKMATYSMNKVRQFFHKTTMEIRDVVDLDSAICYYTMDSQKIETVPMISEKDRLETYPTWSPDGRYLYFCSAPLLWTDREKVPPERYDKVKYDLRRISYNVETGAWGQPETVLSADETGLSILLPRISPDGRFLVFCMCQYGCFPIYQPSSDLYIMDLETGQYRKLDINSEFSESWHSFSSNSRWMAFSSKRGTGVFTRTYFSYIDESGKVYKPFILPQKDPTYYDSLLQTYSVPELIKSPVKVSRNTLARAVRQAEKIEVDIPLTGATIKATGANPWQERE
jgi:hypothetical protein